jgi:ketosteroid isomerase-like protein
MTTKEVADQLVALCRAGKNLEVVDNLMSADVVSVEATGSEDMPAVMTGQAAVRGKNAWWFQNNELHRAQVKGPFPNGDRFTVIYDFVVTPKAGPMAGKKMRMEEVALYTVSDGKITREEFFYDMSRPAELPAESKAKKKPKARVRRAPKKAAPEARKKAKGKAGKAKGMGSKQKARSKARRR